VTLVDVRRLYTGLRLDYRLRVWPPTSVSRAVSASHKLRVRQPQECLNSYLCLWSLRTTWRYRVASNTKLAQLRECGNACIFGSAAAKLFV